MSILSIRLQTREAKRQSNSIYILFHILFFDVNTQILSAKFSNSIMYTAGAETHMNVCFALMQNILNKIKIIQHTHTIHLIASFRIVLYRYAEKMFAYLIFNFPDFSRRNWNWRFFLFLYMWIYIGYIHLTVGFLCVWCSYIYAEWKWLCSYNCEWICANGNVKVSMVDDSAPRCLMCCISICGTWLCTCSQYRI